MLVHLLVDPAGGTSWSTKISNLLCSCSSPYGSAMGGVWYLFPLRIKSGTSIGMQASVNNATVGTVRGMVILYGLPRRPEAIKTGAFVRSFGDNAAASNGTTITPGTTSEGAWTQLGSATADRLWWWQCALGVNDGTMTTGCYHLDLSAGDATTKKLLIEDQLVTSTGNEQLSQCAEVRHGARDVAIGDVIYGRAQFSTTLDAAYSMAAYGLGG
jgi:hypothetical protein